MQAKLRDAAMFGRKDDIIELLKQSVDVNGASEVSHVIGCTCTCMSEGVKWDVWILRYVGNAGDVQACEFGRPPPPPSTPTPHYVLNFALIFFPTPPPPQSHDQPVGLMRG